MTRPNRKSSERETVDMVLTALGLRPDSDPVAGEAPDFMVSLSGRGVGVEVTMYRSGDTVEGGGGRRQVESEWDKLKAASDAFRSAHPELRDVNVGLMFHGPVPSRRQHAEFLDEIAAFIRSHRDDLDSSDVEYWPPSFSTPLMRTHLQTLFLRIDRYAVWHSNLVAGFVATPATSTVADIVADKSRRQFRPADELWLAIQCSIRVSETLLPITGVEDFERVPPLNAFRFCGFRLDVHRDV